MTEQAPHDDAGRRGPLIALAIVVVLVVGGYFLWQHMRAAGQVQDCVMAGRSNCAPVR